MLPNPYKTMSGDSSDKARLRPWTRVSIMKFSRILKSFTVTMFLAKPESTIFKLGPALKNTNNGFLSQPKSTDILRIFWKTLKNPQKMQ